MNLQRFFQTLIVAGFISLVGLTAAEAIPNCKPGDITPACRCGGRPNCTPPPQVVYGTHTYAPSYVLLSLLYDPPGAASNVSFSNSTTEGSTIGISSSFGNGLTVATSASGGLIGEGTVGASFAQTNTTANSTTFSITSTSTTGSQLTSTKDGIDHTQDRFFIWLNPLITVRQTGAKTAVYEVGTANGNPMDVIDVSLAELQNPSTIPASKMGVQIIHGVSLPGLSTLQPSDFANLAAMDTLTSITGAPADTARYVYVDSEPLEGPDAKGADAVKNNITAADGAATAHVQTETTNLAASLQSGGKVDIPGIFTFSLTVTNSMIWNMSNSAGQTSATTNAATGSLGTAQAGCYESVDIYSDTMFHTFAFVTANPTCSPLPRQPGQPIVPVSSPVLSGTLDDASGHAEAHKTVTITLPGGAVRRVVTNSKGQYLVYASPAGTARIEALGVTSQATITPGKATVLDLKAK
jgi:hypothetical protein